MRRGKENKDEQTRHSKSTTDNISWTTFNLAFCVFWFRRFTLSRTKHAILSIRSFLEQMLQSIKLCSHQKVTSRSYCVSCKHELTANAVAYACVHLIHTLCVRLLTSFVSKLAKRATLCGQKYMDTWPSQQS